ncbi:MAG TPA: PDGLE domain-containing protein [Nocardioidaceae bacterium]|nr:PDGLE domain-containing protein [Nocardioidaceae bacterium]
MSERSESTMDTAATTEPTASGPSRRTQLFVLGGLLVAVVLAGIVSFYASSDPDGLSKVSEDKGFAQSEKDHRLGDSPLADYSTKDVDNDRLSGGMAGVIGVGVTFVVAGGLTLLVRRRGQSSEASDDPAAAEAHRP